MGGGRGRKRVRGLIGGQRGGREKGSKVSQQKKKKGK